MRDFVAMIVCVVFALFVRCNAGLKSHFVQHSEIVFQESEQVRFRGCNAPLNYAPDTAYLAHSPMRTIRVNFHFTNSLDSAWNFVGQDAVDYALDMLKHSSTAVLNNKKMFLPIGNETPALPTRYNYVLTPDGNDPEDDGIYTHFDSDLFYMLTRGKDRNNYSRDVIERYAVGLDSVLNIFIMPHHPDSILSETYAAVGSGIALGNAIKMCGIYESKAPAIAFHSMLNHEIGHVFGLRHTWKYNDGCDDTPKHPGCWHRNVGGQCDSLASNNLMDYNAYQHAWTPCQIGKVHLNMARETNRKRKLLIPTWCTLKGEVLTIVDSIHWACHKDIENSIRIEDGGVLQLSCRLSLPKGAKISVLPGGTLILNNCRLHNACGDQWLGIEVISDKERKGTVVCIGDLHIEDVLHPLELEDELG